MIGYVTPELLTFLGIATIAAILIWKRATHGKSRAGFNFMVFGVTYIAVAAFLEYIIDTPASKLFLQIFSRDTWHFLLQLGVYFPGSICVGVGIFRWLPSILQLEDEVAQRKQMETALELTQFSVDHAGDAIYWIGVDGNFEYANQSAKELLGFEWEELGKIHIWDLDHSVNPDRWSIIWDRLQSTERQLFETTLSSKSRGEVQVEVTTVPVVYGDRQLVCSYTRDITKRKKAEVALQKSETKFQKLYEGSLQGICIHRKWEIVFANTAYAKILGFDSPDKIIGLNILNDLSSEEARADLKDRAERRARGEYVADKYEFCAARLDGSPLWIDCLVNEVEWDDLPATQITVIDITERKQAEEARKQSELQFSQHIQNTPLGILGWDTQNICTQWNPAAEKIFEYTAEEAVGKNILNLIVPETLHGDVAAIFDNLKDQPGNFESTNENITKSGQTILCHWINTLIFDETNTPFGTAAMVQDVTNVKNVENQLRHAQKMEAVGQLTGGIAHDFNNILGIVMGNIEILKQQLKDDPGKLRFTENALQGVKRGADITKKLLRFSKQLPGPTKVLSANEPIRQIVDLVRKTLTATIDVQIELADDLWEIEIDAGDLEDVILNLSLNARDAMPEGGTLTIKTSNETLDNRKTSYGLSLNEGDYVMISISDNGSGMTPETRDRLFEPFYTTKDNSKGSGLGLSMVYGFIKRSRGEISVETEIGKGSAFRIYLPRSEKILTPTQLDNSPQVDLPFGNETILVVDDEEFLLEIAVNFLEDLGYKTRTAASGREALDIIENSPEINLLFCDVIMPGELDGYQTAAAVRKISPNLKILLTSGFTRKPDTSIKYDSAYFQLLTRNLLRKPYSFEELSAAVRHTLRRDQNEN